MHNHRKSAALLLLLLGLGEQTQVRIVGYIGISELFIFLVAPLIFILDMQILKRDGFLRLAQLAILCCIGCVVSSWYNHTHIQLAYRGFASCYALFAVPIVFHRFLRQDMASMKWYFIGAAISGVITIYGLRGGAEEAKVMNYGVETVRQSGLFIMGHLGQMLTLPLFAFYLTAPTCLSVTLFMFPAVYAMITSATGRSAVLVTLISVFMLLFVHKRSSKMRVLKKHFMALMIVGFVIASLFAGFYKVAAKQGLLNKSAQEKYERQMQGRKGGLLGMIMSGRVEFFVGLVAIADNPIMGCGPWPIDYKGYYGRFLQKWGNSEDLYKYEEYQKFKNRQGIGAGWIPVHSVVLGSWVFNGILGVPIWLYVLYKLTILMRYHLSAVPQWFGYFAVMIPGNLWHLFFSPFGNRTMWGCFLALVFMAIAVGEGRISLQPNMWWEAQKNK